MIISALPLEALLYKLRNSSTGFNQQVADKASGYGLLPWRIEFPETIYSHSTKNFLLGQVDPESIADQGVVGHNRAWMYVPNSNNNNYEKPKDFSGMVQVALDFNLEWTCSAAKQNFETPSLLVEDAVTEVIQAYNHQNWGSGVVYNGQYSCQRSQVLQSASGSSLSVRQLVMFRLAFQVSI